MTGPAGIYFSNRHRYNGNFHRESVYGGKVGTSIQKLQSCLSETRFAIVQGKIFPTADHIKILSFPNLYQKIERMTFLYTKALTAETNYPTFNSKVLEKYINQKRTIPFQP